MLNCVVTQRLGALRNRIMQDEIIGPDAPAPLPMVISDFHDVGIAAYQRRLHCVP